MIPYCLLQYGNKQEIHRCFLAADASSVSEHCLR